MEFIPILFESFEVTHYWPAGDDFAYVWCSCL